MIILVVGLVDVEMQSLEIIMWSYKDILFKRFVQWFYTPKVTCENSTKFLAAHFHDSVTKNAAETIELQNTYKENKL